MSDKELGWALKNGEIDKVKEIIGSNVSVFIVLHEIAITHQKSVFAISRKNLDLKKLKISNKFKSLRDQGMFQF